MAVKAGELRRWREDSLMSPGTFLVLRCEGKWDPTELSWSILLQNGDIVTGWGELELVRKSELVDPLP